MLGRLVNDEVIQNRRLPPAAVWGDVLPLLLEADVRLVNLECVISDLGQEWRPQTKAFHFRAAPRAIDVLRAARVDGVSLANNHVLDYGDEALLDCCALLDRAGTKRAGAGRTIEEAAAPACLDSPDGRIALIAVTDNEPEWEATETRAGVNHIGYTATGLREPYRSRVAQAITRARQQAGVVVVSAHVGPNWGAPPPAIKTLARELLDLGADVYWGHSNHTPQGVGVHKGKPILYSTGDFIDDYAVDPDERNDLSFLFVLERRPHDVSRLWLHPVAIEECRVRRATGTESAFLEKQMKGKCASLGSPVSFQAEVGCVMIH
jgi:poly-gamma-glutamate synthesis protein (capsule biosynthesis protein)